jgi:integrative and conjugative element protein (TIGR02256 family)
VATDGDVVVTAIIGSGPAAKHYRYIFEPDADYQQVELETHYRATGGRELYLGDWHTHPYGRNIMSRVDKRTLARIALTPSSGIDHPVTAILGGAGGEWNLGAVRFLAMEHKVFFYDYCLEPLTPIVFKADDIAECASKKHLATYGIIENSQEGLPLIFSLHEQLPRFSSGSLVTLDLFDCADGLSILLSYK